MLIRAMLYGRCPRCRQGDIFRYPLKKYLSFSESNEHCSHCGLRYEVEPGFYFGAMFVSYGMVTAITLSVGFVLYRFFQEASVFAYIGIITCTVILFIPVIFRYSRILFLYGFGGIKYDRNYLKR